MNNLWLFSVSTSFVWFHLFYICVCFSPEEELVSAEPPVIQVTLFNIFLNVNKNYYYYLFKKL